MLRPTTMFETPLEWYVKDFTTLPYLASLASTSNSALLFHSIYLWGLWYPKLFYVIEDNHSLLCTWEQCT